MNQQEWEETKKRILEMPLSEMNQFLADRPDGKNGLQDLVYQIVADAELMLRRAAYLEHRIWGGSHKSSVEEQNEVLAKMRKAIGKNITRNVNF